MCQKETYLQDRKMDMLIADLQLELDATSTKNRKKRKGTKKQDCGEPGFHFIAFVPISGTLWKLDGLEHQPNELGKIASVTYLPSPWLS